MRIILLQIHLSTETHRQEGLSTRGENCGLFGSTLVLIKKEHEKGYRTLVLN